MGEVTSLRRMGWVLLAVFVLCVLVAFLLFRAPMFAVKDIQIAGASRTTDGAIRSALAFTDDQPLISIDGFEAETSIESLPWVADADVVRRWPSMVRVTIRERTPSAAVRANGDWLVLDEQAMVLERRLTPPHDLPLIVASQTMVDTAAVGATLPAFEGVLRTSLGVPKQLDPWIESWLVDSDGTVRADLRGSAHALFGRNTDHVSQFVSLASIVGGTIELTCVSEIDLTTPETPILARDELCLEASLAMTPEGS